ncbi:MAG TPA: helix-turn-helix domain-containing protein [Anaeromyxobacteraceae bacterium]|nr:helix-turn-helix domain-containing protein [Anaeromyxobacteraceae bacterium]
MPDGTKDEARLARLLFRYRLIAEATESPRGEATAILRDIAEEEHVWPDGEPMRATLRTLQRWVERYREQKLAGLERAPRKDKGRPRGITEAAIARAIALRKEETARSTPTIIDILERSEQVAKGSLKRSTLDRHLDRRGASRRMLHVLGTKRHVRLSFKYPLDFVVGDFHAGPYVTIATGEIRRAVLGAFIDHCSRYVPESRYGLVEDLMHVRRGLRAFCITHGLMRRLYVDRGPGYQAERFHFGCLQLGIDLVHSKPYVSEGRGVVERFNRTVKEAFEVEVRLRPEAPTLADLNAFWRAWLDERYHRTPHSETGEPPLERWERLLPTTEVRRPDPVLLDEVLRLRANRTVHAKTSCVEVCGVPFVVDTSLRKRRVQVLYDPNDLSGVLVYYDGRRIQRATPQIAGEPPVSAHPKTKAPTPSVDYLGLLRRDHERRRAQEVAAIRFRAADDDAALTVSRLVERLRACCGRALGDVEAEHAASVLQAIAPVEIAIADVALRTAVAILGPGLHASQYLEALREHVLRARSKGPTT